MKRTLLEILSGLAVLVLLASFHHQISRLKVQTQEVAELREMVTGAMAKVNGREDLGSLQRRIAEHFETKLAALENKLASAQEGSEVARTVKTELESTRREADRLKAEIARDLSRTQELVDAYHNEMRAREKRAEASLVETQSELQVLADRVRPDHRLLTEQMLAPTVQLNGDGTVGSGTLVWSGYSTRTKENETYVLTAYHVVRNILADTPRARREGIATTIYLGEGKQEVMADLVAHEEKIDSALLKLRTKTAFPRVARVLAKDRARLVRVWDAIYAVGCPLGNDPIPTNGEISSVRNELNGTNYWMINAPTYFGNSGGGIYLGETRELIGVFSKIYTHGKGTPVVIPHMGLCTPIHSIYEWLEKEKMDFVLQAPVAVQPASAEAMDPAQIGPQPAP
ncbi:MAG: trypsin-like peptidase domain-containing protein, partial [Planctomycetes bacterium]|nr:trypsin-like peptidase domain-containing protein [Planctomycetota bacterium]